MQSHKLNSSGNRYRRQESKPKLTFLFVLLIAFGGLSLLAKSIANEQYDYTAITSVSSVQQSDKDTGILYASKEGLESAQIFRADLDGKNSRRLTNDFNAEHEWSRPSPDGKSILFMKADKGTSVNFSVQSNRLWIMNVDGTHQREIISIQKRNSYGWTGMGHAEWSPDSSKIVLVATLPNFTSQLFTVDANGNNREQITTTTTIDGQQTNVTDPSWSKSNQIMFIRQWNCLGICGNHDVFKMDYATRQETRITNDPHWNYDPYISPDNKTYLWLSYRSSNIVCPCDLIRGNVSGPLNAQPVIADGGANANGTFSSDSTRILFLKQVGLKQVMHQINTDGSNLIRLGNGEAGIASYIPATPSSNPNEGAPDSSGGSSSKPQSAGTSSQSNGEPGQSSSNPSGNNPNQPTQDSQQSLKDAPLAQDVKNLISASPIAKQVKRNPIYAVLGVGFGVVLMITGIIQLRNNLRKNNSVKQIGYFQH